MPDGDPVAGSTAWLQTPRWPVAFESHASCAAPAADTARLLSYPQQPPPIEAWKSKSGEPAVTPRWTVTPVVCDQVSNGVPSASAAAFMSDAYDWSVFDTSTGADQVAPPSVEVLVNKPRGQAGWVHWIPPKNTSRPLFGSATIAGLATVL